MQYSKFLDGKYIVAIAINSKGILITRNEYKLIQSALKNMPELNEGEIARLVNETLQWEITADNRGNN